MGFPTRLGSVFNAIADRLAPRMECLHNEEPGTLDQVDELAGRWFEQHLVEHADGRSLDPGTTEFSCSRSP